jgi:FKBP-type peptidyl-prolyl cis-trans isomerase 2
VGQEIHALTGLLGEVVSVDADSVIVDFDPDRSGQVLTFDVEVLKNE